MIFLFNNGPGRFGNHIYNIYYLQTLSKKYGHNFRIKKSNYLNRYFYFDKGKNDKQSIFKPIRFITNKGLNKELSIYYNYILIPPLLGNNFFSLLNHLDLNIKDKFSSIRIDKSNYNVAIHFRGTDFHSWNKNAILDSKYYIECIEEISMSQKKLNFYLYTDDYKLDSYNDVIKFLMFKKNTFYKGNLELDFIYDFKEISECDCIISSPSTFCIWASVLGKQGKTIFHSKKWVNYSTKNSDKFWIDLKLNGVKYYKELILK